MSVRCSINRGTGFTPFELQTGRQFPGPQRGLSWTPDKKGERNPRSYYDVLQVLVADFSKQIQETRPGNQPSEPHTDHMDDVKKVMRREQNRVAAQKSRMRQTQKADTLRLESEKLERENAVLGREVNQLTEEAKCLSAVLSHHQPLCFLLPVCPVVVVFLSINPIFPCNFPPCLLRLHPVMTE
uniref:Basic leucine zipper transcriptional factor ATF-like n=1 Tax=Paramormyrops kingsleyae TaxID=1676925 RepID=A0A3B3S9T3_9TELE